MKTSIIREQDKSWTVEARNGKTVARWNTPYKYLALDKRLAIDSDENLLDLFIRENRVDDDKK